MLAFMFVCVAAPRLVTLCRTSYDWLNKFITFIWQLYIVSVISRLDLSIEVCHRNQLMRVSYRCTSHYFHCNSYLKQLARWSDSVINVGMAYVGIHVSRHLKEELAWAIDKWLWIISNIMLFKTVIYTTKELKNKAVLNLKQYCMYCYMALSNVF